MVGRRFSLILVLLTLVAACMVVAPALSGEHPWDSDTQNGKKYGPTDAMWSPLGDTSRVNTVPDSANNSTPVPASQSVSGARNWVGVTAVVIHLYFDLL
jgi:hypothetical protein